MFQFKKISKQRHKIKVWISVLSLVAVLYPINTIKADTVSDLKQQQAQLQAQAATAKQQAEQQKTLAERAADSLQQATAQISDVNTQLDSTQTQISSTQDQISQKNQDIASLESNLRSIQDQENALVRQLYIMSVSQPDSLALFSDQSMSNVETQKTQFSALEKASAQIYAKTKQALADVNVAKSQLEQKNDSLTTLKAQQQSQHQYLANVQSTQQALRYNAEAAEQQLEAKAASAQAAAAKIAQRIKVLTAVSNWGNQIVSSDDGGWYYSQTGDNTYLGYGPYTVSEVGCFVTSIAMVAKYYGHPITPDYIAQNGIFYDGYLVSLPSNLGITLHSSQGVNWNTVNHEISEGRPVIISIYLPSVGAVNSDGSSHFIVIKGSSDGKYLMHDPIGDGRSYNLNQVRSMILVSNN